MTLHAPFILFGLPRNHHMHHLPTSDITRSSQDQIKLGINNTVVIIKWPQGAWSLPTILAQHHEYPTTRYPRYHGDHLAITTNLFLIIEPGLLLSTVLLLLLTHSVTSYELGPYPRARLSIDLINTLQRLAHFTHTTEPMASHSHSGGPTAFRQNRSIAMTLSRPLRLTPHWASPGWPRVYQRHNDHRRGQNNKPSQTGTRAHNNNNGHTRLCLLTGPGYHTPITFPRWRHRREARQ